MAYREENGYVVLTLTSDDYTGLMLALRAVGFLLTSDLGLDEFRAFVDRINDGNPNVTPCRIGD